MVSICVCYWNSTINAAPWAFLFTSQCVNVGGFLLCGPQGLGSGYLLWVVVVSSISSPKMLYSLFSA